MSLTKCIKEAKEEAEDIINYQKRIQGEIPKDTCPLIDSVINAIQDQIFESEQLCEIYKAKNIHLVTRTRKQIKNLRHQINTLEKIREANSKLRNLGEEWYSVAKEIKDLIS